MIKKEEVLYQHFTLEERDFAEKMIGICQQVEEAYSYRLTPFLNPREEEIVHSIARHFQLSIFSSRKLLATEFVRLIIAPDYYVLDVDDFEMMALEIIYPRKFHSLSHSQVLGTLLNQLGIRREFIGDILIGEENLFIILEHKFGELTKTSVSKISRVPVTWRECPLASLSIKVNQDYQTVQLLMSSLRLDKFVAAGFKLSRTNSLKLIESGQVKVNYREVRQAGKVLQEGQLVSVRGFGRLRLKELLGYSKQGKLKIEIEIIKK